MKNRTVGLVVDLPTQHAARRAADAFLESINAVGYRPGVVIRFSDFAARWQSTALPALKPTTQRVARGHLDHYLMPALGDLTLQQVTTEIVQRLISSLIGKLKRHTILNILGTMSSMMATAKAWGYHVAEYRREDLIIPQDSELPRRPYFTPAQVRSIIYMAAEPWRTLFMIYACTGVRGAEALALSIEDVDFESGRIFIRKNTQQGRMQLPKTKRSIRTLPMPDELAAALRRHLSTNYIENPHRLLFCSGEGNPLWLDHVRERRLWPILEKLEIPQCGFHAFRRTTGSVFASIGAPVKVAQEHLGHTDPRITLEIYQHVVGDDHRHAAGEVARVLLPECYPTQDKPLIH
jgi:integrase